MKAVFEKHIHFDLRAKEVENFGGYPPLFHSHCELIYVTEGKIDMSIDGHTRTLSRGEFSVTFPYVTHSYKDSPKAKAIIILFDAASTGVFEGILMTEKPTYPYIDKLPHLLPMFSRIVELTKDDDPVKNKTASVYLSAIIGEVLGVVELTEIETDTQNVSHQILAYCSEHFLDDDISIGKISDVLYVSKSYVSKVFSNKLGYKFREYINILKINHAKKLLSKKEMKILDVMFECGFKNQSSFNRIFLEACGVSPRDYKRLSAQNK